MDPAEWLDDYHAYWLQCQYDDGLTESANLELTLRNEETETYA